LSYGPTSGCHEDRRAVTVRSACEDPAEELYPIFLAVAPPQQQAADANLFHGLTPYRLRPNVFHPASGLVT